MTKKIRPTGLQLAAALEEFFTDLSILVRKTPAPCPWCGGEVELRGVGLDSYPDVKCSSRGHHCYTLTVADYDDEAVREHNRVAVPMAFRRLAQGDK